MHDHISRTGYDNDANDIDFFAGINVLMSSALQQEEMSRSNIISAARELGRTSPHIEGCAEFQEWTLQTDFGTGGPLCFMALLELRYPRRMVDANEQDWLLPCIRDCYVALTVGPVAFFNTGHDPRCTLCRVRMFKKLMLHMAKQRLRRSQVSFAPNKALQGLDHREDCAFRCVHEL